MHQELILDRPIVSFDLETTGLDVQNDRIVEFAAIKLLPHGERRVLSFRVNPKRPINPEAMKVHGIRDEDVRDLPGFEARAREVAEFLDGADLTGFNIERFDLPMLSVEFKRVRISFPFAGTSILDSHKLFLKMEPRDLTSAYRYYCNATLEDAHAAEADAQAALDVLLGQVKRYPQVPTAVHDLAAFIKPRDPNALDQEGKLKWRDGQAVITFGKHRGRSLQELVRAETNYLHWILDKDFAPELKGIIREALDGNFPKPN